MVLTQNGAGDINASFVNTETLEQCQQKTSMVAGIFTTSSIPIIESRCFQTHLEFSAFGHASASSMIRYFYLIKLDKESVQIDSMPDWRECMAQLRQATGSGKVYCSSSVQVVEQP